MPMIFFVIPRKRELQSGEQAAAGDLQLLHHFTAADQIHPVVEIHHRTDVVGIEFHLVAHPDRFPEAGVIDDGVLVVHVEYMNAFIALDETQTGGSADAFVRVWAVMPLAPTSVMTRSAVGRLMTVVRMVAAQRSSVPMA